MKSIIAFSIAAILLISSVWSALNTPLNERERPDWSHSGSVFLKNVDALLDVITNGICDLNR